MPPNVQVLFGIGALVFLLICITGGNFGAFSVSVPGVSSRIMRVISGLLGVVFLVLTLIMVFILPPAGSTSGDGTSTGTSSTNVPVSTGGSDATSQVLKAFNSFCQALHANQLDAAFKDLTPGFQQSVGSSADLPGAVGGTFGPNQETATDCSVFFPPSIKPGGQDAVELGSVVVTDSTFGTHTISRNFEFVYTNGKWLINNIYGQ